MASNEEILASIDAAIKAVTDRSTMGYGILNPEKLSQFVQTMQDQTVILKEARFLDMPTEIKDIDRIALMGRVLKSGGALSAANASGTQAVGDFTTSDYVTPNTYLNKLIAKEMVAIVGLTDQSLETNIEKGNLENTMMTLLGDAAGRDFEEFALLAHYDYNSSAGILKLTDGWVKKAGNKIYGNYADKSGGVSTTIKTANAVVAGQNYLVTTADLSSTPIAGDVFRIGVPGSTTIEFMTVASVTAGTDTITFTEVFKHDHAAGEAVVQIDGYAAFNPNATNYPENMFDAALLATPKKYLQNLDRWAFYVTWDVANAYQDLLKTRNTALGDANTIGKGTLAYKGVAIKIVPMLDRSETYNGTNKTYGAVCLFSNRDNMVWGLNRQVRIESQRLPVNRRTDFVLSLKGDVGYEDENAATAIFIDMPAPAS